MTGCIDHCSGVIANESASILGTTARIGLVVCPGDIIKDQGQRGIDYPLISNRVFSTGPSERFVLHISKTIA